MTELAPRMRPVCARPRRSGPQVAPFTAGTAQALESLFRLEEVEASLVLPGHGAEWPFGVRAAVAALRSAEAGGSLAS
ncbi:MAG TPA: hypothetical protein VNL94_06015 [Candidatus Binatia bacterium]|nr:hypothetical protein [Candidatus Binatia bacterium]